MATTPNTTPAPLRVMGIVAQVFFFLFIGVPGVVLIVRGLLGKPGGPGQILGGVLMLAISSIPFFIFRWQRKGLAASTVRVQADIDAIAARLFDAPVQSRNDFEGGVFQGSLAQLTAMYDTPYWPGAEGTYQGANVAVASHASIAGRQMFETSHVYSYVAVDLPGYARTFVLTERSTLLRALHMGGRDTRIGDPSFESAWSVDADEADARAALTPLAREHLNALQAKVGQVSIDIAQGRPSVYVTPRGLTIRWPGSINVELAQYMRDTLMEMRRGLIAQRAD